ncbi:MAG: flagellar biosynthesis protein FliR [Hyphococcus sp.]|nr:MAG: flagellar biosynthesis protein FliR [Marinicaulis sp.]
MEQLTNALNNEIAFTTIAVAAAIFTRMSAISLFLPGLGERSIPVRVRLMAAMGITLVVYPLVSGKASVDLSISGLAFMLMAEAVAGALIGFSIRIAIFTVQIAGSIASQSLSLAQLFGASIGFQPESPIATILMITCVVLAVSSGLHFETINVLSTSYTLMPLGAFPGGGETGQWAAERVAFSFAAALSLALPFVTLGFIYNLAIGAANRAMPQLMVAFVGIPAVTLAGLVLLAMSAPVILGVWIDLLNDIIRDFLGSSL